MIVVGWPDCKLGSLLASELGARATALAVHRFPDGEALARIDPAVKGEDVVFAVSLDGPDAKLLPLLFAADAARELGARRIVLAAPYLAYMRQDTRFHPGEAVSSRTFAGILSARFDALATVDPHLHRWHSLADIYAIPALSVRAAPAIAVWLKANVQRPLLVGPDEESAQWVAEVARLAEAPYVVMRKERHGDRDVTAALDGPIPDASRTAVLLDDMISTGHTLSTAADVLRAAGMRGLAAVAVHALFDGQAQRTLHDAGIATVVTCDTIEHPSNAITVVPALARAVRGLCGETTRGG